MSKKKILMINISRSPIAMTLTEFENFEKNGSEYICSKVIIKFVKDSNVTQELVDWADIICTKYHYSSDLIKNSNKLISNTPVETLKKTLYGEQTLYIVRNNMIEVTIEKKIVSKDEIKKYFGFVFTEEEEAINTAKELIKNKIKDLNSSLQSFEKQLRKLEKEKTL